MVITKQWWSRSVQACVLMSLAAVTSWPATPKTPDARQDVANC